MGEIRIVGPGKTCGYPYPVCKKTRVDCNSIGISVDFSTEKKIQNNNKTKKKQHFSSGIAEDG